MTELFTSMAFYTFGLVSVGGAIGVVTARRLVHCAMFLVLTFVGVAAVYLVAGADYLAGVQLLIYAGAIVILILFAIMLTPSQREDEAPRQRGQKVAAGLLAVSFLGVAVHSLLRTQWPLAATPSDGPTVETIGQALLSTHVLPFEVASVLLLAALVGAILIARED